LKGIYLDHNATTRPHPAVVEEMRACLEEGWGNPSSSHAQGQEARRILDRARVRVAALISADPDEILFTSGGTESDNQALRCGAVLRPEGAILASAIEHSAVLDTCKALARQGRELRILPVDAEGILDPAAFAGALEDPVALVSVMLANNDLGTIQPVREIALQAKARGAITHTDAVQAAGKLAVNVRALGVDLLSLSAHKLYGPKGVGALFVRRRNPRVLLTPIIDGGGHERGMRSGTLNVPGIVGFGKAAAICRQETAAEGARLTGLRDRLWAALSRELDDIHVNGSIEHRLPGNLNVSFAYVEGESLLMGINDVAVSSGSACTSATLEPSYVLKALGTGDELAHSSIRFGLGRFNTAEEVDYVAAKIAGVVKRLREISPLYEMAHEGGRPKQA